MNAILRSILDFMAKENTIIQGEKSKGERLFNPSTKRQDDKALFYILVQLIKSINNKINNKTIYSLKRKVNSKVN